MSNDFIDKLFNDKADYYLVQMRDISNATTTHEGSTFLVSFVLPREYWGRKLEDITVGEYRKLERSHIVANICLSELTYPPFQLGQTISEVARCRPLRGIDICGLVDKVRNKEIENDYYSISRWVYEQEAA